MSLWKVVKNDMISNLQIELFEHNLRSRMSRREEDFCEELTCLGVRHEKMGTACVCLCVLSFVRWWCLFLCMLCMYEYVCMYVCIYIPYK